ncbi:MAG: iron ABC transporter permease [Muribaculaceae bacterium]|jgi:iron complex transport system permease protein|nr:iron ABC transporter permease [Muribaculaceae bacterium]
MKFFPVILLIIVLFLLNLFVGSVDIPAAQVLDILLGGEGHGAAGFIVTGSRLPMAVTAMLAGAGLAVSGLMLQTSFRNPLAGPSVLGINSGASLGVALVMLLLGGTITAGTYSVGGYAAVMVGAFAGSILIMGLLLFLSTLLRNGLMLLITGIMIGYLTSSVIMLLNFVSTAEGVQSYVMWGMSSFNGVSLQQLPLFSAITIVGLVISLLLMKPLNLMLLGDGYAQNLGVNLHRVRNMLLLATGILTAVITAYCGPVAFIGLSVPHISRLIFRTDNHRVLMPGTLLVGSVVALGCNLMCVLPANSVIPLNAVTPLIGAPVVIWVLFKYRSR